MGHDFIPTLIQTVDWEAVTWDEFIGSLSDVMVRGPTEGNEGESLLDVCEKVYKGESVTDELLKLIEDQLDDNTKKKTKELQKSLKDFAEDMYLGASGVVAIRDPAYREVIMAFHNKYAKS